MNLPETLLDEFAKATNDEVRADGEYTAQGKVVTVNQDGTVNVQLDGATGTTPCRTCVNASVGDRVIVSFKNRQAVVTSNLTKKVVNADFLEAGSARFKGHIEATSGSFAGDISAATGNFGGTLTVNWRTGTEKRTVKIGSDTTAPFVMTEAASDASVNIFPDSISIGKNGGRMWAQLDIYNGPDWYLSDRRLKNRISDLGPELAKRLRPVSYHYTEDDRNRERYGFIAQEVSSIMPDAVTENKLGSLGLSYTQFIAPTLALAQENAREIEALKQEIQQLKGEINELKHNSESSD